MARTVTVTIMAAFPHSAADAVVCSSEMHRSVAALDENDPARLRIGLSVGEVSPDGSDSSGMPVVEAARLQAGAAVGQTLASNAVRLLVGNRRSLQFGDGGELALEGIPTPVRAVEVLEGPGASPVDLLEGPDALPVELATLRPEVAERAVAPAGEHRRTTLPEKIVAIALLDAMSRMPSVVHFRSPTTPNLVQP